MGGESAVVTEDGTVTPNLIPNGQASLTNKHGELFPDYFDIISGHDAGTEIMTNWTSIPEAERVPWNNQTRADYIAWYSETFGNQASDYWTPRDIHHIRPRLYAGTNEPSNLMPIIRENHRLITTWFVNY